MAKLNQRELEAVAWKIHSELEELRDTAVEAAKAVSKSELEKDPELKAAWDILRTNKSKKFRVDITFLHTKTPSIPRFFDIKNMLIIEQIGATNIQQVIDDLTKKIAQEIGL